MKNSKALKALLAISGLIGVGIGAAILFAPAVFYAPVGLDPTGNASQASELRAPGGALVAAGAVILVGAVHAPLALIATVLSATIYLSYGIARLFSMAMDGLPDTTLLAATGLELIIGALSLLALMRYRKPEPLAT